MALPKQCPLCASDPEEQMAHTRQVYGSDGRHAIYQCKKCSVRYLYPSLSEQDEKKLYAKEFEAFMTERSSDDAGWEQPERHITANKMQFDRRMKYMHELLPDTGRLLEVGCSSGFMLYPLKEKGYDCVGVEPSNVFSEYVNSRGVPCYSSMEDLKTSGKNEEKFDVIMHFFVLEHIRKAKAFLQEQLDMLKPGGVLIFEIPNANDALSMVYDLPAYERFIWVISHHWYFDKPALEYLVKSFGFECEVGLDQRYDLSNHMVWMRDGKLGGGRFTPKLGEGIENSYKKALIDSGFCDTLVGIIKKE